MPDGTTFRKVTRLMMDQRQAVVDGQENRFNLAKKYCDYRRVVRTAITRCYCKNRGHLDFSNTPMGAKLECDYSKCPFLNKNLI